METAFSDIIWWQDTTFLDSFVDIRFSSANVQELDFKDEYTMNRDWQSKGGESDTSDRYLAFWLWLSYGISSPIKSVWCLNAWHMLRVISKFGRKNKLEKKNGRKQLEDYMLETFCFILKVIIT